MVFLKLPRSEERIHENFQNYMFQNTGEYIFI
jgi:hypothetical protein